LNITATKQPFILCLYFFFFDSRRHTQEKEKREREREKKKLRIFLFKLFFSSSGVCANDKTRGTHAGN
jgi:hypothetical protein